MEGVAYISRMSEGCANSLICTNVFHVYVSLANRNLVNMLKKAGDVAQDAMLTRARNWRKPDHPAAQQPLLLLCGTDLPTLSVVLYGFHNYHQISI
jgi:hypothetical protein